MNDGNLKPCPFCGSDRIQFRVEGYIQPWENKRTRIWYYCECYDCGGKTDTFDSTDIQKSIQVWNRRAE